MLQFFGTDLEIQISSLPSLRHNEDQHAPLQVSILRARGGAEEEEGGEKALEEYDNIAEERNEGVGNGRRARGEVRGRGEREQN